MKSKKTFILVVSAVAVLGALGSYLLFRDHSRPVGQPTVQASNSRTVEDERIVLDQSLAWDKRMQAAQRLAPQQNEVALDLLREFAGSDDEKKAAWAIFLIGFYEGSAGLNVLRKYLQSPSEALRSAAISGVGLKPSAERLALVDRLVGDSSKDIDQARIGILRIRHAPEAAARQRAIKSVMSLLQRSDLDSKVRSFIMTRIFDASLAAIPEVRQFFLELSMRAQVLDESSALVLVEALKVYCPSDRFAIFSKALQNERLSPAYRQHILSELMLHPGPEAGKLLDAELKKGIVSQSVIKNIRSLATDSRRQGVCSAPRS